MIILATTYGDTTLIKLKQNAVGSFINIAIDLFLYLSNVLCESETENSLS